ncbi:PD40 domain-containing protein [Adhaeribacter radiodurans]|uniref:PD40 domain-containing protein n=1 Tax=Adhaeribacter radiodurans TaxID=2745197 RepID=A0A7L7L5B1_9BACT|nr:PD40 domain-containing protein [Adhaeribacter radiodurans]QMU27954.1 PD40 domain-containing protein [Adhaeribacter radiodurans]
MNYLFGKSARILVLLTIALLFSLASQAQNLRSLMKTGDKYFALGNYRAAIPYYEQALNENTDNAEALFKAGVSFLAYDKDRASDYLYKAQRLNAHISPDIEYWLGRVDHVNYRFEDAIQHYEQYANTLAKKANARQELAMLIAQSRFADKMVRQPKDLFVRNLGPTINTPFSDHSPVISRDSKTLIYTTRSSHVTNNPVATDGEYNEEIVEAIRLDADDWSAPRSLSLHLNSKGHDASIQLYDNETKLLLYRQTENGDFYYSMKDHQDWGVPQKVPGHVNTSSYESDAFITADGSTMYFATNHFSKTGDKDLYVAQKTIKGDWGKPKNLGKNINTSFDEDSPFLTADGKTLYFTSRGHATMGGSDVFVTHFNEASQTWSEPENMGYPVNSPDDDTYFRLSADGLTAYLSSYRMGGYGEKDIWSIDLSKSVLIRGLVSDQLEGSADSEIEVVFSSKPLHNKLLTYSVIITPGTRSFELPVQSGRTYKVTFSKNGQVFPTQECNVPATTNENVILEKGFSLAKLPKETAKRN